jgi:hypothetical protein
MAVEDSPISHLRHLPCTREPLACLKHRRAGNPRDSCSRPSCEIPAARICQSSIYQGRFQSCAVHPSSELLAHRTGETCFRDRGSWSTKICTMMAQLREGHSLGRPWASDSSMLLSTQVALSCRIPARDYDWLEALSVRRTQGSGRPQPPIRRWKIVLPGPQHDFQDPA